MNMSLSQVIASLAMAGVTVVMVLSYRRYLAESSKRRMRTMLESIGLDPEMALSAEFPTVMKEIRQRCRHCAAEDVCERWLNGHERGDNSFCPNAKVFEAMKKYRHAA